jgi:hypothetical protein
MAHKNTTSDQLAAMIQEGFKSTATKADLTALEERVNTRFDGIDSRLGRIEQLLLAEQKREIADLQKRLKRLEDAVAL